jgi:hypothetical protein
MSGTLPWSSAPAAPVMNDPNDSLRRIEQNTASLVQWMKYLVFAVIVLIVVNVVLFV